MEDVEIYGAKLKIPPRYQAGVESGWLAIKTVFNSGHVPDPPKKRLTMRERVQVCVEFGHPKWAEKPELLAEAASVMSAESLGARRAYLARVKLPAGQFFLVDEKGEGNTVYRSAGYQAIRKQIEIDAPWDGTMTAMTFKRYVTTLECKVVGFDRGLFQHNDTYWKVKMSVAMAVQPNIERAAETWESWDETWNAWMSYRAGTHLRFMADARKQVAIVLGPTGRSL